MRDFSQRFRGTLSGKVDAKGRVVIPSRFREIFERNESEQLVVTANPYGYLMIMAKAVYEKLESSVSGMPDSGGHSEYFKQTIIGMAEDDVEFDSAGRIKIGKALLEHASIISEVTFLGMDNKIRLWSKQVLDNLNSKYRHDMLKDDKWQMPDGWDETFRI